MVGLVQIHGGRGPQVDGMMIDLGVPVVHLGELQKVLGDHFIVGAPHGVFAKGARGESMRLPLRAGVVNDVVGNVFAKKFF